MKIIKIIVFIFVALTVITMGTGCVTTSRQGVAVIETKTTNNNTSDIKYEKTESNAGQEYKRVRHTQETRSPAEEDEYIRNALWHMPTIEDTFEDNLVYLLFRYDYEEEIGLDYFQDIPLPTEVVAITDFRKTRTLYAGDQGTIQMKDQRVKSLFLTLSTHDKQIVLDLVVWLMRKNEVLTAEPFGYGEVISCTVPSDPYLDF